MTSTYLRWWSRCLAAALVLAAGAFYACGKKAPRADENLLQNGSFEKVSGDLPAGWKLENFRGLKDAEAETYGLSDSLPYEGDRSFYFGAGAGTSRFYTLAQEVWVKGAKRVRIRGAIRTRDVGVHNKQYPQASIALTYYDERHGRFESARFADVRTDPKYGSTDGWVQIDEIYRLPLNTAYVVVHCVLGMQGEMWFDDISVEIPTELPWREIKGENFTHYWLDKPYPEGSIAFQQQIFESYAEHLGIPKKDRPHISYYFYPDTTSLFAAMGVRTESYVDPRRRQIHSIHPAEDHEIAHFLTDPYGTLPTLLEEGTAFYLMDDFGGARIMPLAQELLRSRRLAPVNVLLDHTSMRRFEPAILVPSAATFVGYLLQTHGSEKFLELHRAVRADIGYDGFAQAIEAVYGRPLSEIEAAWVKSVAEGGGSKTEDVTP
jgi:hypothetical protein